MTISTSESLHDPRPAQSAILSPTRPFYWSVRRELWENRSLYIAPLAVAGLLLFGFLLGAVHLATGVHDVASLDPARQGDKLAVPFDIIALALIVVTVIVAVVYCLGALHGERRDRSILFWKSLPVSDLVTVLSKAVVPLAILPMLAFAIILAVQLIVLVLSSVVVMAHGLSATPLWVLIPWPRMCLTLAYGLAVLTLWYAPVYAWLMLVSGWARRVTFLWAVLPPVALCVVERIAFHTGYLGKFLGDRLGGGLKEAFISSGSGHDLADASPRIDLAGLLASPGLWIGLAVAAALFTATIWRRRRAEPI